MGRALVLSNEKFLVGMDRFGQVRDLYFPYVGLENHVGGHFVHRIGVFTEGKFKWLSDVSWRVRISSKEDSLISDIVAVNDELGVSLVFKDAVSDKENVFIRSVHIENLRALHREIKLYFGQEFEFHESHAAHTAYYDPLSSSIIHYKQDRVFLAHAKMHDESFSEYTTGIFGSEGKEGSFRDAEDGGLSQNGIEHGQADSVIGISAHFTSNETKKAEYWLVAARSIKEAHHMNNKVMNEGVDSLLDQTETSWEIWVNKYKWNLYGLSEGVATLFKKSLMITKAHTDHQGGIIASSDSSMLQQGKDTYSYVWPRDASFAAMALYRTGSFAVAKNFFEFASRVIEPRGYFLHKYEPDGSLGSSWHPWIKDGHPQLPIQEDETALVIISLWQYYKLSKDIDFIESVYQELVKKPTEFLMNFRDKRTGLPLPSYDLWEEVYGVHTFTVATVCSALSSAAKLIKIFEGEKKSEVIEKASEEVKAAMFEHLYDEKRGVFYKSIVIDRAGNKTIVDPRIDMSSVYAVYSLDIVESSDERLRRAVETTEEALNIKTGQGGVARYEGDGYLRQESDVPGNPWIITTLWLAEYYIKTAKSEEDLLRVKEIFEWVVDKALPSGILPEQIHPKNGRNTSATPLVWSHAAFVNSITLYLDKLEELGICKGCNPVGGLRD
jgi:oligosaccharide amylase